jgi:hypothetical protein
VTRSASSRGGQDHPCRFPQVGRSILSFFPVTTPSSPRTREREAVALSASSRWKTPLLLPGRDVIVAHDQVQGVGGSFGVSHFFKSWDGVQDVRLQTQKEVAQKQGRTVPIFQDLEFRRKKMWPRREWGSAACSFLGFVKKQEHLLPCQMPRHHRKGPVKKERRLLHTTGLGLSWPEAGLSYLAA